jgi:hypothetical protein
MKNIEFEITFTIDFSYATLELKAYVMPVSNTKYFIEKIELATDNELPFLEDIFIEKIKIGNNFTWVHTHTDQPSILAHNLGTAIEQHFQQL